MIVWCLETSPQGACQRGSGEGEQGVMIIQSSQPGASQAAENLKTLATAADYLKKKQNSKYFKYS